MTKSKADNAVVKFASLADAGLQTFEAVTVHRSELKNASYNPRTMTEAQRKKLKAGLARNGLVAPPTWNVKTGNVVGGHQRLAILDQLMGSSDYTLTVARIDVPEGREKELNILLNNSTAQGDWDVGALTELFKDDSIQVEGTGFDLGDVYQLMGEAPFQERADDAAAMAEKLDAVKGLYDTIRDKNKAREDNETYIVVVFRTEVQAAGFLTATNQPLGRYQNGEKLAAAMGIDVSRFDLP